MKRILFAACVFAGIAAPALADPKPSLAEPSISPSGEIAFVSGGDIWTAPAAGGSASLLVSDPATERRPLWSPDGSELAFTSTRNGAANIYVLNLASGALRRITWSDTGEQLDGWSRDGKWLYFSSAANDVARQNDVYRVSAGGGTPLEVSRERYLNEFNAAPSPDGKTVALMAKGLSSDQWWRNGHSHIDEAELWLKPVAALEPYRKLLGQTSKQLWPMWAADGRSLYFMSDKSGAENIWRIEIAEGAQPAAVTSFTSGRLLFPSISYDGRTIVFEREFAIWKLDLASGQAGEVPITLRGAPAGAGERRLNETSFRSMAVSPDGKKVAVIAHGDVFAASTADGGPAQRITETPGAESDLVWSPDSRKLVYVSERGLKQRLMEYDFGKRAERTLTEATDVDASPAFSPDGKMLAYQHGTHEVRLISFGAGAAMQDKVLFSGPLDTQKFAWSPDSKWLAFAVTDPRSFTNVWVAPVGGGDAKPVSFLANGATGGQIAWSADGKYLVFDTSQRSEPSNLVRIDLLPHTPKYREDAFRELFAPGTPSTPDVKPDQKTPDQKINVKPAPKTPAPAPSPAAEPKDAKEGEDAADDKPDPAAKKKKIEPVKIVFEGIRERATFLPLGFDAGNPVISPDGKRLVFSAGVGDENSLYSYSLDELAKEPPSPIQIAAGRRPKSDFSFSPDSKTIYYLDGGRVTQSAADAARPKVIDVSAELVVNFDAEKQIVFDEAWSLLDRRFYDAKFHGQDWKALRERFQPYVQGAKTPDEMRRVIGLMIGELNASHSGVNGPPGGASRIGDLGLRFDREAYEAGRGLVVREVVPLGPAAIEGSIRPGDVLEAVDGVKLAAGVNLDSLLQDRIDKRTVLTVATAGKSREAVVRPLSPGAARGLLYRAWVNDRRAYVEKASGGRLGYVHILDMSEDSLKQLYIDLDAQNQGREGVVIDVRNNNGGFVNGYVLDVFTRKNFLTMTPRDFFAVPSRQNLGQRALGLPTVLVTNESSLSDAEDFTEGYRALGIGKVVGTPTAGWIIYTSNRPLIDGSSVRVPFIRIQGADGKDLEGNPRPVDVMVQRQLGETLAGKDSQLDAAVAELLKELGPKK